MRFSFVFERVQDAGFPAGDSCAHILSVGLTTHGRGLEGARQAVADLLQLWLVEQRASGGKVAASAD